MREIPTEQVGDRCQRQTDMTLGYKCCRDESARNTFLVPEGTPEDEVSSGCVTLLVDLAVLQVYVAIVVCLIEHEGEWFEATTASVGLHRRTTGQYESHLPCCSDHLFSLQQ